MKNKEKLVICFIISSGISAFPLQFNHTILTPLLRGKPTTSDYTSRTSAATWNDMQQIAYIAADDTTSTDPLYRYYGSGDHRDSCSNSIPDYTREGTLGYIYNSSGTGMSAIRDYYSGTDHATSVPAISGYFPSETLGYGYKRYGNDLEDLLSVSWGDITVECNRVFGGALWHINYDGVQFINNFAQGRQVQMSCRWIDDNTEVECVASEVGRKRDDFTSGLDQYDAYKHMGSPMVYGYVDTSTKRICTQAIPMEFKATTSSALGGGTWSPVLYDSQTCSKVIHYNYNDLGPVMRYRQIWTFPSSADTNDICQMEASIHLNAGFTNVFRYHPENGQLEDMDYKWWDDNGDPDGFNDNDFGISCYIFADDDDHCLGVVARDADDGGTWEQVTAINCSENSSGSGEFDDACNVMYLLNWLPYQAGNNNYYYYMIVGDLTTATNKAQALYDTRTSHQW